MAPYSENPPPPMEGKALTSSVTTNGGESRIRMSSGSCSNGPGGGRPSAGVVGGAAGSTGDGSGGSGGDSRASSACTKRVGVPGR